MTNFIKAYVPFDGFDGYIQLDIEDTIEREIDYYNETHNTDYTYSHIDYSVDHTAIAEAWASAFFGKLEQSLRFTFPIDYKFSRVILSKGNFGEEDKIEVLLSTRSLLTIWETADKDTFADIVRQHLKPVSGFIPFFSNDIKSADWQNVLNWNASQIELLLESAMSEDGRVEMYGIYELLDFSEAVYNNVEIIFPDTDNEDE